MAGDAVGGSGHASRPLRRGRPRKVLGNPEVPAGKPPPTRSRCPWSGGHVGSPQSGIFRAMSVLCGKPTPDGKTCRRPVRSPGGPCGVAHPAGVSPTGAPPSGTPVAAGPDPLGPSPAVRRGGRPATWDRERWREWNDSGGRSAALALPVLDAVAGPETSRWEDDDLGPLKAVAVLQRARREIDDELRAWVQAARRRGLPWEAVAEALDVTPQAARQRWAPLENETPS